MNTPTTPTMGAELPDERLLHLRDTHVGEPSARYPLTDADWINFGRACIAADRQSASRATPADATYSRDQDWVLAMGHALGLDSGHRVPIVPSVEEFKRLFAALTANQASEAPPVAVEATKAVALTDEQIVACLVRADCIDRITTSFESGPYDLTRPTIKVCEFVREIERVHGIGLDNKEPK